MNKTLLVTDLDGTLLNQQQQVSEINKNAIKDFKLAGGQFTIATGRMEHAVKNFVRDLGIDIPMILYNGAKIVDPCSGEVLFEQKLHVPIELWTELAQIGECQAAVLIYMDCRVYTFTKNEIILAYEKKDGVHVEVESGAYPSTVTKIVIISTPENLEEYLDRIASMEIACTFVYSEKTYLEILPDGVSKGETLKILKKHLPIETDYTVCIGDNLNDYSMIEEADLGIAVENAHPKVKEIADQVVVHHEEHAIAEVIHALAQKE